MSENDRNSLIGLWKLKSIQFEVVDTGEIADVFDPNPSGYLIHTGEGRMMAILMRSDRAPPKEDADGSALFKTMMAYTGNFRIEGDDKFITHADLAWHPLGMAPSRPGFSRSRATPFRSRPLSKPTPCLRAGSGGVVPSNRRE